MLQAQVDRFGAEAVRIALATLGEDSFRLIRDRLYDDYKIAITDDSLFTLEELEIALSRLLGDGSATFLLGEIKRQILDLNYKNV